jgi:hypothetical protein
LVGEVIGVEEFGIGEASIAGIISNDGTEMLLATAEDTIDEVQLPFVGLLCV